MILVSTQAPTVDHLLQHASDPSIDHRGAAPALAGSRDWAPPAAPAGKGTMKPRRAQGRGKASKRTQTSSVP